jgi:hypothetical protein
MKIAMIGGIFALSASACMHPMTAPVQSAPPPPAAPQAQVVPTTPGAAIGVAAYPLQQQDAYTQNRDETYCWQWSRSQTGIDPMAGAPPVGGPPPGQPPIAGAARGAALGAAGGAAIGAIAGGSAGRGAAIGSIVGAAGGHTATRQANAAAAQEQAQAQAQASQAQTDQFKQAYASCLVARGYSIQ